MERPVSPSLCELDRIEELMQRIELVAEHPAGYAAGVLDTLAWIAYGKPSASLTDLIEER